MTAMSEEKNTSELAFGPIYAMTDIYRLEQAIRSWDVTRRITMCFATQSRDAVSAVLRSINSSDDGQEVIELLEGVRGLIEHYRELTTLFEAVEARMFISAHDVFGIPLSDTEPN